MEKIKKLAIFSKLGYGEVSDLVLCPHCENTIGEWGDEVAMLVPKGTSRCPNCGGIMLWHDDDIQEVKTSDLINNEEIELFDYDPNFIEIETEDGFVLYNLNEHREECKID